MNHLDRPARRRLVTWGIALFALFLAGTMSPLGGIPFTGQAARGGVGVAQASSPVERPTVVYLLRHAEKKQSLDPDPELTQKGHRRALQLAVQLAEEPIDRIYSSEYRRALATVAPLAQRHGLEVERYEAADRAGLVARVLEVAPGETVVISGHSNTVPDLAFLFGYEQRFTIRDSEYGDLFRLTLGEDGVEMRRLRFGD